MPQSHSLYIYCGPFLVHTMCAMPLAVRTLRLSEPDELCAISHDSGSGSVSELVDGHSAPFPSRSMPPTFYNIPGHVN
jgi:hypothetical protein